MGSHDMIPARSTMAFYPNLLRCFFTMCISVCRPSGNFGVKMLGNSWVPTLTPPFFLILTEPNKERHSTKISTPPGLTPIDHSKEPFIPYASPNFKLGQSLYIPQPIKRRANTTHASLPSISRSYFQTPAISFPTHLLHSNPPFTSFPPS